MYLLAFIIEMFGIVLLRRKKSTAGYALLATGWTLIIVQNIFFDKNWYFAIASLVLGALLIAFIAYDNKR